MAKRHDDALYAQVGACNGLAVSKALAEAYAEANAELHSTDAVNRDAAVRLILHQLCHLARIGTYDMASSEEGFEWHRDEEECRRHASDRVLAALRLDRAPALTAPQETG